MRTTHFIFLYVVALMYCISNTLNSISGLLWSIHVSLQLILAYSILHNAKMLATYNAPYTYTLEDNIYIQHSVIVKSNSKHIQFIYNIHTDVLQTK